MTKKSISLSLITFKKSLSKNNNLGFRWLHDDLGSNFRITEIQSAIGRIQMRKLNEWTKIRNKNAMILKDHLCDIGLVRLTWPPNSLIHGWYKFYCYINLDALSSSWNRIRIIREISSKGFPALEGGCSEIYLEKSFIDRKLNPVNRLPNAKLLGDTSLMFLIHPTITEENMNRYAKTIREVLKKAMK